MSKYLKGMFIWSIAMVVSSIAQLFAKGHLHIWGALEVVWFVSVILWVYCAVQDIWRNK